MTSCFWCDGPAPDGAAVWYQKHMTHHLLPGMDTGWVHGLTNVFLIRDRSRGEAVIVDAANEHDLLVPLARATGVGISRAVSAGNAAAITVADYLDWYSHDPATAVSLAYVEGIVDGKSIDLVED